MSESPQDDFTRLFIESQGSLYGYIATLLPHRDDAEEVLQRTSMVLWQKWDKFDPNQGFLPWARGIALNEVRNLLRRSERRNVHLSEPVLEMLVSEMEDRSHDHRTAALSACLERLQRRQRELLEQCYLGAIGINAVAESIGSSPAALYMRLHRIRKSLIECIDREVARGAAS